MDHLYLWSEVPTPQTPWAGLRKPGAGVLSLTPCPQSPLVATMDCSWMNLLKLLLNGHVGSARSWGHPLLIFTTCCTKAGSRIPKQSSIWMGTPWPLTLLTSEQVPVDASQTTSFELRVALPRSPSRNPHSVYP